MQLRTTAGAILASMMVAAAVHAQQAPAVAVTREEDFVDIDLTIMSTVSSADGGQVMKAQGLSRAALVGFSLELLPGWRKNGMTTSATYEGLARLNSLGAESDRFLALLAKEYGVKGLYTKMAPTIRFSGFTLEGDPLHLDAAPVRIRLMYEGKPASSYAEVYAVIDLKKKRLGIHERASEFRTRVLKALLHGN